MVVQKDKASASEKEFAKKWDSTVSSTGFVTFSTLASKAVRDSAAATVLQVLEHNSSTRHSDRVACETTLCRVAILLNKYCHFTLHFAAP
jgi:hypothetical protein